MCDLWEGQSLALSPSEAPGKATSPHHDRPLTEPHAPFSGSLAEPPPLLLQVSQQDLS